MSNATADDVELDLDALLDYARDNEDIAGSRTALRLEQHQSEVLGHAAVEVKAIVVVCGACGVGPAYKICGGCKTVRYCDKTCQVAHWLTHKARCRVLQAEAAVTAAELELKAVQRELREGNEVVHNPDTEAGNCFTCGANNPRRLCSRCMVAKYCGVPCQTQNWKVHKEICAELKRQYAAFDNSKEDLKKTKFGFERSKEELHFNILAASNLGRTMDIYRLVVAGADVNTSDSDGRSPLALAAQMGHARAITVLVDLGAFRRSFEPLQRAT